MRYLINCYNVRSSMSSPFVQQHQRFCRVPIHLLCTYCGDLPVRGSLSACPDCDLSLKLSYYLLIKALLASSNYIKSRSNNLYLQSTFKSQILQFHIFPQATVRYEYSLATLLMGQKSLTLIGCRVFNLSRQRWARRV